MSMETAAYIGMGIIALFALSALGLALWSSRRTAEGHKGALPSH